MKPAIVTLTIYQGQDFTDQFVFQDADEVPEDFTGYSARMQIRTDYEAPDVVLELSTTNGLIAPLDSTGTVTFAVDAATTAGLSSTHMYETWWYDLEVESPSGVVQRLMQGAVVFWPEITR